MRLLWTLIVDLFVLVLWLPRALLRLVFAPKQPPLVTAVLKGRLLYLAPPSGLLRFNRAGQNLEQLARLSAKLAASPRAKGLLLELRQVTATAAQWDELARIIGELKAAGKKVAVYAEGLSGAAYAAVCGADLLCLPPSGDLHLIGVSAELTTVGAGLRRIGVRPRFARREAFKTAPELFTEDEPSAAQRQTVDKLLDSGFAALKAGLGRRGLSEAEAGLAIDGGPYSGRTALTAKLIDRAIFRDEVPAALRQLVGIAVQRKRAGDGLPGLSVVERTGRFVAPRVRPLRRPRAVALVPLNGVIASGKSRTAPGFGMVVGSETTVAALEAARKDRRSPSALVTIDSRGGSAIASEIVWRELTRLTAEKPTLVYVDSIAASGGYLIACGAKRILSAPRAIVGSIGVFSGHFDLSGLLDKLGIHQEFAGRGAHARLVTAGPLGDADWAVVEALADDAYGSFLEIVAKGRGKTVDEVRPLAQGKVYTGTEAAALGLIDGTCGFAAALAEARSAGGLATDGPVRLFGSLDSGGLRAILRTFAAEVASEALVGVARGEPPSQS